MKKISILAAAVMMIAGCNHETEIIVPNEQQKQWADAEIGILIHYDMQVFNPDYQWREWGTHPDPSTYCPTELNTDQWMEAASKIGAKYAILVAKHCCGFSLWPTNAHEYSVKNCPWKDGKGDIVKEFVESCHKYGIKPGLYASTTANGYYMVDNPGLVQPESPYTQEEYNQVVERQLTELWSNYGELFEIWFDGGVLARENGGANVLALLSRLQPNAIVFQGPFGHPNLIRWVGNEEGTAPYPCWATADSTINSDGIAIIKSLHGRSDAPYWCPGEADFTLRYNSTKQGGWSWAPGEDDKIFSVDELMKKYESSVGRNSNMLLGLVVDPRGLVPESDFRRLEEFGKAITEKYGNPDWHTSGRGNSFSIEFENPVEIDRAIIQEDLSCGERILSYRLIGICPSLEDGPKEVVLAEGTNVGHKHIDTFKKMTVTGVRLDISSFKATPEIRNFAIFKAL